MRVTRGQSDRQLCATACFEMDESMTSEMTERDLSTSERLPLAALLALATSGFITILTEALPAGLLPQMGSSLKQWSGSLSHFTQ